MTVHRDAAGDPIFVDRTGRRRRVVALAGSAGALVLLVAVLTLLAGFTGTGPATPPGWTDAGADRVREAKPVASRTTPAPAPRTPTRTAAAPVATSDTTPSVAPSAGTTSASPSADPTPTARSQRRVPTHTPSARPSKKH